ncbi:hypothetical protein BTJ45_02833 [Bacillus mycoides]|nr:hypothetical protein BTJ45_02833 [Bacillus mycoides]
MNVVKQKKLPSKMVNTAIYFIIFPPIFLIKVSEFQNIFIQKKKDRKALASYPHLL